MTIHGNIAVDGYGLNSFELSNVPTNGYGAGILVQFGGAVIESAETLLADFAVLESLIVEVEDAIAPAVDLLELEEATAAIEASSSLPTAVAAYLAAVTEVQALEELLQLEAVDSATSQLTSNDSPVAAVSGTDEDTGDLTASDGPATTIDGEDDLSGR